MQILANWSGLAEQLCWNSKFTFEIQISEFMLQDKSKLDKISYVIADMNYDLLLNCLHTAVNSQTVLHSILWICAFFTNLMVISHLHSYFSTGQICGVLVWECVGSNIQLKHVHFNFFYSILRTSFNRMWSNTCLKQAQAGQIQLVYTYRPFS